MLKSNTDVGQDLSLAQLDLLKKLYGQFRRAQTCETDIPSVREDLSKQFSAKYSYGTVERKMLPIVVSRASACLLYTSQILRIQDTHTQR